MKWNMHTLSAAAPFLEFLAFFSVLWFGVCVHTCKKGGAAIIDNTQRSSQFSSVRPIHVSQPKIKREKQQQKQQSVYFLRQKSCNGANNILHMDDACCFKQKEMTPNKISKCHTSVSTSTFAIAIRILWYHAEKMMHHLAKALQSFAHIKWSMQKQPLEWQNHEWMGWHCSITQNIITAPIIPPKFRNWRNHAP